MPPTCVLKYSLLLLLPFIVLKAVAEPVGKIALILDDAGYNLTRDLSLRDMGIPLTLAVIPDDNQSAKVSAQAINSGFEVLLHMPMESHNGKYMGNLGLKAGMTEAESSQQLTLAISQVPDAVGLSNHMGSKLTSDPVAMQYVMSVLSRQKLFFVDSLTTSDSVATDLASKNGVPWIKRQVFLDNQRNDGYMDQQFQKAIQLAKKRGAVVIIGHTHPETLEFLRFRLPLARDFDGIEFVPVSALLAPAELAAFVQ